MDGNSSKWPRRGASNKKFAIAVVIICPRNFGVKSNFSFQCQRLPSIFIQNIVHRERQDSNRLIFSALSIQAHPDKKLAEKLFKNFPDLYKDPNHKPELVMALTEMEMLCQFRKIEETMKFLKLYPELCETIGVECVAMVFQMFPLTT